jgi:hypothetical protein
MAREDDDRVLSDITGMAVTVMFNGQMLAPFAMGLFGSTRIELLPTRVVEDTKYIVSAKQNEILLSEIDNVEYAVRGNQLLLVLGFAMLPLCGVGLIFLLLYCFLFKYRFLIIRSRTAMQVIGVKGDPDRYLDFMQDVLAEAERVKGLRGGSSAPSAAPAPPRPSPRAPAVTTAPESRAPMPTVIACPNCRSEYRLPPGSGGKKFRCQNCKGVIEAPIEADLA